MRLGKRLDWLRKPAPKVAQEDPMILVLEPKIDMTAFELASILRWAKGVYPLSIKVVPAKLKQFAEDVGGDLVYRHFRIDESGEAKRTIERKAADLIGHELTTDVLAELTGRLEVADLMRAQAKRAA